jgi:hypothetical protein
LKKNLFLIHNDQYSALLKAIDKIKDTCTDKRVLSHLRKWPSIFTGVTWVVNRITPPHRDRNGFKAGFNFLLTGGDYSGELKLRDIGITFSYRPGCVFALAGRVLTHEVGSWSGKDRICMAHWTRERVLMEAGIDELNWATVQDLGSRLKVRKFDWNFNINPQADIEGCQRGSQEQRIIRGCRSGFQPHICCYFVSSFSYMQPLRSILESNTWI